MNCFVVICATVVPFYLMLLKSTCVADIRKSVFVGCKGKQENFTNVLGEIKLRSNIECTSACLTTNGCRSTSFRRNEKICRMYTETMVERNDCGKLVDESSTIFSFLLPQCIHGGTWDSVQQICTQCDHGFAGQFCERHIIDCYEGMLNGYQGEEEIRIQPMGYPQPFLVLCDYIWGRTTTLHRGIRYQCNGSYENFNRTWSEYRGGFGTLNCEFFIGLERLYFLTKQRDSRVRVKLFNDTSYTRATYRKFIIADEDNNFTMSYQSYKAHNEFPAGDGFGIGGPDASSRDSPFCTQDRDCGSCAKMAHAGWWYSKNCSIVNVHTPIGDDSAIYWPLDSTNNTLIERDSIEISILGL